MTHRVRASFVGPNGKRRRTPEYMAWVNIVGRTTNPNNRCFHRYGGRGITICAEWRYDFAAFLGHVGPRPSVAHSIDRIDNNRGYEPGNVRWATYVEQRCNQRRGGTPGGSSRTGKGSKVRYEVNGELLSAQEIADRAGVARTTITSRVSLGITGNELLAPQKGYMRKPLTAKQRANIAEGKRRSIVAKREQRAAIAAASTAANTTIAESA